MDRAFNEKKRFLDKIVLPSSLVYFPASAVPDNCQIESRSIYYRIINDLLIDTRKKCIIKCLNKYIDKVAVFEPIEEIGDYAFINCEALREILLPNTLKIIGKSCFQNCKSLNSITIPDSVETISENAFFNCKCLQIQNLPQGIKEIGDTAFQWCNVNGIIIPSGTCNIGISPFPKDCKEMKSKSNRFIIIDSMLIDNDKKELIQVVSSAINRIEVPNSIIKIRESAFAHSKIESIIIPSSVIELEDGLFWNCKNLTEVFLECNIEMLPNSIFAYCESLSSVKMPNGINVIGTGAFSYCRNLQAITLNQNLRVINDSAFFNCENLTFVNIPKTVEIVGNKYGNCFKGCKKLNNLYYDAEKAELAGMPNSIFSLTIGEHVQTLPKRFLSSNDVIEKITIPQNVQRIEQGCIDNCSNLKEISILSNSITIEEGWIKNCNNLRTIRIQADIYESLLPFIPNIKKLKIKKIFAHHFLFYKW